MNPKKYGGVDFGNTLEELKKIAPHAVTMEGVSFDGPARKVGAILALAGVGAELVADIEQLTHERDTLAKTIGEAVVKAGIAAAGMPLDGPQLLMLVDDLAEYTLQIDKDAERFAFFAHVAVNDELHDALEPHMPADAEQPENIEGVRAHMDLCIQAAKDAGLWPLKPELELTEEAQADRDAFNENYGDGNCSCHLGSAPCSSCTHPGNPVNQAEDPACWKVQP